jgi:hypothetical protein
MPDVLVDLVGYLKEILFIFLLYALVTQVVVRLQFRLVPFCPELNQLRTAVTVQVEVPLLVRFSQLVADTKQSKT